MVDSFQGVTEVIWPWCGCYLIHKPPLCALFPISINPTNGTSCIKRLRNGAIRAPPQRFTGNVTTPRMSSDVFDQAGQRTCSLVQPPGVSRPSLNKQELSPSHVNTRVNAAFILFGGGAGLCQVAPAWIPATRRILHWAERGSADHLCQCLWRHGST